VYPKAGILTLVLIGSLVDAHAALGQGPVTAGTTQVIDLNFGAPVREAINILRQRYHLAITYEGPAYVCSCDLIDMGPGRKTPSQRIITPKRRQFHFEYMELNGKPVENTTFLLMRLLSQYASQGGEVFDVSERQTPTGSEWNVVAVKAHDESGAMTTQIAPLDTLVFIPKEKRSASQFIAAVLQQVRTETGYDVEWWTLAGQPDTWLGEYGADNIPARDTFAQVFEQSHIPIIWELNYDPESNRYFLTFEWAPSTSQSLKPIPAQSPSSPPLPRATTGHIPPASVLHRMTTVYGRTELQSKLAQAGYYTGTPNGQWDQRTVDALKNFQVANSLPATGELDPGTIRKLGLDIDTSSPH